MNLFDFPPLAALLDAASTALGALGGSVTPGLAIVLVTVAIRAALRRRVPRTAQSDPDARGHARPRAPGRLLTAV